MSFLRDEFLQPEMREREALPDLDPSQLEDLGIGDEEHGAANATAKSSIECLETVTASGLVCRVTRLEMADDSDLPSPTDDFSELSAISVSSK